MQAAQLAARTRRRLRSYRVQGGSGFPVAVVVGVVALILVIIGVVLWRKERAISKSLVNCTSSLRDSPAPTTASGGGCGSREEPPVPSIFESGSQNRHHHNSHTNPGSTQPDATHSELGSSSYFSTGMWDDPVIGAARIVMFVNVGWDSLADLCVVSEFMVGGDLRGLLHAFEHEEKRAHGFDHDKVIIALHVAHAITYLHSLDPTVLHRDLKSKNILLDDKLNAKVMDFGVSREQSDRTLTAGVGTLRWMASEVMVGDKYDEKADVFSFGVVLSELDTHAIPYAHAKVSTTGRKVPDTAIVQMVSSGKIRVAPMAAEVLYQLQRVLRAFDDADEIVAELRAGL
ncbi:Tkl protein kinase [Globisporangium polare]